MPSDNVNPFNSDGPKGGAFDLRHSVESIWDAVQLAVAWQHKNPLNDFNILDTHTGHAYTRHNLPEDLESQAKELQKID